MATAEKLGQIGQPMRVTIDKEPNMVEVDTSTPMVPFTMGIGRIIK